MYPPFTLYVYQHHHSLMFEHDLAEKRFAPFRSFKRHTHVCLKLLGSHDQPTSSRSSQFYSGLNKNKVSEISVTTLGKQRNQFRVCWFFFKIFGCSLGGFHICLPISFHDYMNNLSCWCYLLSTFVNPLNPGKSGSKTCQQKGHTKSWREYHASHSFVLIFFSNMCFS